MSELTIDQELRIKTPKEVTQDLTRPRSLKGGRRPLQCDQTPEAP
jgi:hypothetical protein